MLGNVPSKKNQRINTRSGRSFPSKAYTEWHHDALMQIKEMGHLSSWAEGYPVSLELQFIFGDKRKKDIDNRVSSIQDLLVDAGILEDDDYQHVNCIIATAVYSKGINEVSVKIEKGIFDGQ